MDIILSLFGIVVMVLGGWIIWESEQVLEQRRRNYRAGTHDYYGNKL